MCNFGWGGWGGRGRGVLPWPEQPITLDEMSVCNGVSVPKCVHAGGEKKSGGDLVVSTAGVCTGCEQRARRKSDGMKLE